MTRETGNPDAHRLCSLMSALVPVENSLSVTREGMRTGPRFPCFCCWTLSLLELHVSVTGNSVQQGFHLEKPVCNYGASQLGTLFRLLRVKGQKKGRYCHSTLVFENFLLPCKSSVVQNWSFIFSWFWKATSQDHVISIFLSFENSEFMCRVKKLLDTYGKIILKGKWL